MSTGTPTTNDEDPREPPYETAPTVSPHGAGATSPSGRPTPTGNKKGSRTLTQAQLDKKRANDREAQRAIRERTKNQIELLEKRIKDLESGQAYQQLQAALKQKQIVEAENQDLRNRLAGVMELLRPLFAADQLPSTASATTPSSLQPDSAFPPSSIPRLPQRASHDPYNPHISSHEGTPSVASGSWHDQRSGPFSPGPPWEPLKSNNQPHQIVGGTSEDRTPVSSATSANGVTAPTIKRRRSPYDSPTASPAPQLEQSTSQQYSAPSRPLYTTLPANIPPTCRYDNIIHDFYTMSQRRLAEGESVESILGGSEPVLNGLLDPTSAIATSNYFSGLLIDVLKAFSAIKGWPEKIGIVSITFEFIKWLVAPTKENYEAMPGFLRPVDAQLKVAHPMWIDQLPWPSMRHKMVYSYFWIPLDNFFLPYTSQLSINYPHQELHACLYQDSKTGEMRVHPDLYKHARNLDNWSLGLEFQKAHSDLATTCWIKDS